MNVGSEIKQGLHHDKQAEYAGRTRQRIVESAREMLIGDSCSSFAMDAVAKRACVTRMTVYNQFGSRVGLLEAVADDLTRRGEGVQRNTVALSQQTPTEALRALVTMACRFWSTDPALFRRFVGLSALDLQVAGVLGARDRVRRESTALVMRRLAEEGRLLPPLSLEEATAVVTSLTSFTTWDQMRSKLSSDAAPLDELIMRVVGAFVRLEPAPAAGCLAGAASS